MGSETRTLSLFGPLLKGVTGGKAKSPVPHDQDNKPHERFSDVILQLQTRLLEGKYNSVWNLKVRVVSAIFAAVSDGTPRTRRKASRAHGWCSYQRSKSTSAGANYLLKDSTYADRMTKVA